MNILEKVPFVLSLRARVKLIVNLNYYIAQSKMSRFLASIHLVELWSPGNHSVNLYFWIRNDYLFPSRLEKLIDNLNDVIMKVIDPKYMYIATYIQLRALFELVKFLEAGLRTIPVFKHLQMSSNLVWSSKIIYNFKIIWSIRKSLCLKTLSLIDDHSTNALKFLNSPVVPRVLQVIRVCQWSLFKLLAHEPMPAFSKNYTRLQ